LFDQSATNKSATVTGITSDHIVDDKLVESWTEFDNRSQMQQLGMAPTSE